MANPSSSTARSSASSSNEVVIDGFRRHESIGKGSFATVYRGIHPADGSLVAIKSTNTVGMKGKLKSNLLAEIDILKSIHHPHVVGLIAIVDTPGYIHLVMEFCQLGDLATFVKKREKLATHPVTAEMMRNYPNPPNAGFNEVVVRHFSKQLASALEFLRSKHIVHRDLKPQNLLLNPPPSWLAREKPENRPFEVIKNSLIPLVGLHSLPSLKIADFGFARHLPTTTMAETLCGSPLYMAPEILRYERYDAKADLWSVGTVLYELMVGRAPFRAANHVDLLRKIERANDKIKFPEDLRITDDMKIVIRRLLKRLPIERMSWEDFFQSAINTNDIPGLVPADKKEKQIASLDVARLRSHSNNKERPRSVPEVPDEEKPVSSSVKSNRRLSSDRSSIGTPPAPSPLQHRSSISQPHRPPLTSHPTAPAVQTTQPLQQQQQTAMERRRSQESSSPRSAAGRDTFEHDRVAQLKRERAAKDARERAAQDVADEREYVVVEKRAVEVNAFADEMAASPQLQGARREGLAVQPGQMPRRATTQAVPLATTGASPPRNMQVAVRGDALHNRQNSYERRFGTSQLSATSALAAALNMVNFRLGSPTMPQIGKSPSPPQSYGAFPTYPINQPGPLLIGDATKPITLDEDQRILTTVEETATRSDVVYGFAEVKYKQLVPAAPSTDNALGMHRVGSGNTNAGQSNDDEDLTPEAIVTIAEEALVLYVKTLSILTNTISIAGSWWHHKTRGSVVGESPSLTRTSGDARSFASAGARINLVVQWSRSRFNECLEKSEYVSRRLRDAQKKLPRDHPGHPDNHADAYNVSADSQTSNINLCSGVTAEALMYDRALDMNTTAAINELMNIDLEGCEVSYVTAIRLLEAVVERDGEPNLAGSKKEKDKTHAQLQQQQQQQQKGAKKDSAEALDEAERLEVLHMIKETRNRLTVLQEKMSSKKMSRRPSQSASAKANSPSLDSPTAAGSQTPKSAVVMARLPSR